MKTVTSKDGTRIAYDVYGKGGHRSGGWRYGESSLGWLN